MVSLIQLMPHFAPSLVNPGRGYLAFFAVKALGNRFDDVDGLMLGCRLASAIRSL